MINRWLVAVLLFTLIINSASGGLTHRGLSTNTANTNVARDSSGNFSAGTITASLTGAASLNVLKAGDTMSGTLNMGSNYISSLLDPSSAQDAATKNYVDGLVNGLNWKTAAEYATASALPSCVYANGSSGVGATLTGVALGALSIDGITPSVNDRILVKNQAAPAQNGIYSVTTVGSGAAVFVLTRTTDFDQSAEIYQGDTVFVVGGNTLATTTWSMTTTGTITVGTTGIVWTQVAGPGFYTAGTGISISGTTISLSTPVTVANGGTGVASFTAHNVLTGGAAGTALGSVAPGSSGNYLKSDGTDWTSAALSSNAVTSFAKQGSSALVGDVTISGGSGITLTQSSQNISIAASGTPEPTIQVKTANYTVASSDDELIATASITFTLPDCTGLSTNHVWNLTNAITTSGNVTITAGGANTFYQPGAITTTVYNLNDPGTSISVICNKGSTLYVR